MRGVCREGLIGEIVGPYNSTIFAVVQDGDITALVALLSSGNASIHNIDLYSIRLLYIRLFILYT